MKYSTASGQIRLCVALALGTAITGMPGVAATGHPDLRGYWVSESGPGGRGGPGGPGGPSGAGGPAQGGPQFGGGGPQRGGALPPRAGGPPGMGPPGAGGPQGRSAGPGGGGARPQPSEAGIAAAKDYEQPFDDPGLKCDIANIIFGWTHDQNVNEISQSGNTITLKYGYMDFVRSIHLDAEHPKGLKPTRGGHSTGKWEGDTLVVDTVALAPSVLIPMAGIQLSDKAHIIERFTLDPAGRTLTRNYVVEDPLYLRQSYSGRDVMAASKEPYTPYECEDLSGDNNKRPAK